MRAVLCNLMVVVMTVPALLGWCCHPCFDQSSCQTMVEVGTHTCNCCDHHDHKAEQPTPGNSCSQCKGVCTYVLTSKLNIERPNHTWACYIPQNTLVLNSHQSVAVVCFLNSDQPAGALQPLRLHAVHQLWLI
jgi:hypothetical protein